MSQATSLTSRWYSTPRAIEPEGHDHDGKPYWKVEGVTIRVQGETLQLSAPRYGDTRHMRVEVADGELRFPLEDLVPLVLERLDITELSRMICGDKDARREVLDALARKYNEHSIEDDDRRYWIAKVKAAVHDAKLDALVYQMSRIEHGVAQTGYRALDAIAWGNVFNHAIVELLRFLGAEYRQAREVADEMERHRFERYRSPFLELKPHLTDILGARTAWDEARDFWRERAAALFANVEIPDEVEDL